MKKSMRIFILLSLLLIVLVGCDNDTTKETTMVHEQEQITLDFWNLANEGDDEFNEAAVNVISTIEEEYPNIKINYNTTDGNEYKIKIKAAVAAGDTPDIFYTWLPGFSQAFVDEGKVLQLNEYLSDDTYNNINNNILELGNASYDGIYALSIEVKMGVLYCNKDIFHAYDISIPNTYSELLTTVDEFNNVGIQPLLVPGKRLWPIMWLYDILAVKSIGATESLKAINKSTTFSQIEFLEAAVKMRELSDKGAFVQDAVGLDNIEANQMFLNGEIPMYFAGSWFANNITSTENANRLNVVVKRFPGFENEYDKHMLGGNGVGYMVGNNSEHKEEAVLVLEKFTQMMAESDVVTLPAWNVHKDYSQRDPIYAQISTLYNEADDFVIWWDTYMNNEDAQTHKNLTLQLFAGVITPEEFIEGMQDIEK